ncbi:response regulator [Lederbergia panacisoli]|uniref:response regulator n=1 Tax=Lederbergia panacisoli TaxID=1255251 RepID=UPI00214B45FA|nr:response regulator [Lederbergia panacisoli]MCR2821281.1 response regulator [Lederbergia panacisoli]
MKIRTKLLLILGALPILLFVLAGVGWSQFSTLSKMGKTFKENYQLAILSEQIHRDIKDEGIHLRNLVLLFNDQAVLQDEIAKLKTKSDSIIQNIRLLESKVNTDEEIKLIATLKSTNNDFNAYKDKLIQLISNGDREAAISLISEDSVKLHEEFFKVISEITSIFEINMENVINSFLIDFQQEIIISLLILSISIILIIGILFKTIWTLSSRLNKVSRVMTNVANGSAELKTKVEETLDDEIGDVAHAFNSMVDSLEEQMQKEQQLTWTKSNIAQITTSLSGTHELETLAQTFLSKVVPLMEAGHAVFYVKDMENTELVYKLLGSYAFKERKHLSNSIKLGEGLVGQAALEKQPIVLTNVPSDYIRVRSGLGEAPPLNVYVLPISFEGEVNAVLEIASFKLFDMAQQTFIEELIEALGIILESVMGRIQLAKLLEESQALMEETQAQSEELQTQQEELRASNEELEEQTRALRESEEKLQIQQEELEQTNADLEEKTKNLEEQNKRFERKNKEVESARAELEEKARQLELTSKYKSQFLANMSHELRTPLNSLLILSKLLSENPDGNLTGKQMEYSKTIYSSGQDLLSIINEILDLSKIESGKVEVMPSDVNVSDIVQFVESNFRAIASEKNINFMIKLNKNVPSYIYTDQMKIQQVLKNLLSNAFKFTHQGDVILEIGLSSSSVISFSVIDTGIGIPSDKQELIFEAFQQADGTTSRKYGGTGLGLSICKEIANLLGGEIKVESTLGEGSTFTLYINDYKDKPVEMIVEKEVAVAIENPNEHTQTEIVQTNSLDDERHIKRLLIVDDDIKQRNSLMELIGEMDFIIKAVSTGTEAMEELKVSHFDCMILDLGLADTSGFELLKKIKQDDETNNVKVFIYTGRDLTLKDEYQLNKYAYTIIIKDEHSPQRLKDELQLYLTEKNGMSHPAEKTNVEGMISPFLKGKTILLVDDDVRNVYALSSILEYYGMNIRFAENGIEGLESLQKHPEIDLVLMDIMMPEMDGYEAIRRIKEIPKFTELPIIALTAKAMKEDREKCMKAGASDYIVKPIETDQLISLIKVWLFQKEGNK